MYKDYINIPEEDLIKEVNEYLYGFTLNEQGYFTESDADYLVSGIPEEKNFNYETGATKCVIIPDNENFVIKIPFNGKTCSCRECDEEDPFECHRDSCPILPLMYGGGEYQDDYCAREVELYNKIVKEYPQFKNFFLSIEKILEINHYPVYIQRKGVGFESITDYPIQEKSIKTIRSDECHQIGAPDEWLAKCFEDLGNNIYLYNQFITMLKKTEISRDLHSGNVGFCNGHAVIIDYGGFFDFD